MPLFINALGGIFIFVLVACTSSPSQQQGTLVNQISATDSCDGPDTDINCCFEGMPGNLSSIMLITATNEPGERLLISGTMYKSDGKTPCSNALIYAYHTDNKGIYSKTGKETGVRKWHGRLHGWCKTDAQGRYEIHTVRPASYPKSTAPAHIHAAVKLNGKEAVYIKDFVFADDPYVDDHYKNATVYGVGTSGIVELKKQDEVWYGTRDIIMPD